VPGFSCESALPFNSSVSIADTSVGSPPPYGLSADLTCPNTAFTGTGPVFWLKLEGAPSRMLLDLTSCGLDSFDTDLSVFQGPSCGELSMFACNGDAVAERCATGYSSRITGFELTDDTN
jgi:predicted RNA-binding Zn-ribbon protein involved in translation (DUF1610 family)